MKELVDKLNKTQPGKLPETHPCLRPIDADGRLFRVRKEDSGIYVDYLNGGVTFFRTNAGGWTLENTEECTEGITVGGDFTKFLEGIVETYLESL